ncbi:MAG: glycosyltransferase, partial [Deltaproteobacteria bacterium]|nr:glycosyltransferase [Nannocystaceae bacterium]
APAERAVALAQIPASDQPITHGRGDVVVEQVHARNGQRELELDSAGFVVRSEITVPPSPTVLERRGDADGAGVVLTFDDGPDPRWTPEILAVLAEHDVRATFFVVGTSASDHPELVRRTSAAGHLVASHSWDHPDMTTLSPDAVARQLERTARLLESLVEHQILFYRAPYTAMLDTDSAAALAVQDAAFAAGYAYVTASVDPADWSDADADAITRRVLEQVDAGGRVVVLHDGGGDRGATVAALRELIPELQRRGHPIVGLGTYLGLERAALAPPLSQPDVAVALGTRVVTEVQSSGAVALQWLFTICTILAAARILALGVLVLRRRHVLVPSGYHRPLVTVLLPAFNEGKVIEASIRSLLGSEYDNLEILVIDDGSTDDTAAVVARMVALEPRVRYLHKSNGGKASAANFGIGMATGEILVAVDADTVVAPDAIRRMVAHFADPGVAAVCGNVEVGNVCSTLTAFQAIEYVTSQNFDRRAFAALNCIGVVPGALGAWRRAVVLAAGGYSHDTLVEDADLTLSVLAAGGRITYEPHAIGRTEAPQSLGALWKQRFRWTYGTYQCLAKHRGSLFRGSLGWIALPNVLLFQVLFPILSPIGDFALAAAIVSGSWSAVLSGYLGFLAMDLMASALAFRLDRKPMRWLPLLLIQRFTYRQFLYLVSFRAMVAVLAGSRHGWRKLERTGSVITLPQRASAPIVIDRAA